MRVKSAVVVLILLAPFPSHADLTVVPKTSVAADLDALMMTLHTHYPRSLAKGSTLDRLNGTLRAAVPKTRIDRRTLCGIVGSIVGDLAGATARMPKSSVPCFDPKIPSRAMPTQSSFWGPNIAADDDRLYALDTSEKDTAILGIRHFDSPSSAGWAGFDKAIRTATSARALILDLRGTGGNDPRAIWPLVEALAERRPLTPLHEIVGSAGPSADALRRAFNDRFPSRTRDLKTWTTLLSEIAPPPPPKLGRPRVLTFVLIGPGCKEACQLVARTLEKYAKASMQGYMNREPGFAIGGWALFVLPNSKIEVVFPTTIYRLHSVFNRYVSLSLWWRTRYASDTRVEILPFVKSYVRSTFDAYQRADRWKREAPTPCADLPDVKHWHALAETSRKRIDQFSDERRMGSQLVTVYLPLERARKFIGGCPGVTTSRSGAHTLFGDGAEVWVRARRYRDLLRLAQSETVMMISVGEDTPMYPD